MYRCRCGPQEKHSYTELLKKHDNTMNMNVCAVRVLLLYSKLRGIKDKRLLLEVEHVLYYTSINSST